jgi:hypothetical protein
MTTTEQRKPRTFTAKYAGRCDTCMGAIKPGQRIQHSPACTGAYEHADEGECNGTRANHALAAWQRGPRTVPFAPWLANSVEHGSLTQEQADIARRAAA